MIRLAATCLFVAACSGGAMPSTTLPKGCAPPLADVDDGLHLITIPQPDGTEDRVYVAVSSPAEEGKYPIVVFAHSRDHAVNCSTQTDGIPPGVVKFLAEIAREGFVAVATSYRTTGELAPATTGWRPADNYLFDARTLLGAAEWARVRHRKSGNELVLIGASEATRAAFWAATPQPELEEFQRCLAFRSLVLVGGSANLVANPPESVTLPVQLLAATGGVGLLRSGEVQNLPEIGRYLTPDGVTWVEQLALSAGEPIHSSRCQRFMAPLCDEECRTATQQTLNLGALTTLEADEAWAYYQPPGRVDPEGSDNGMLAMMRALSPVFAANELLPDRALHVMSTNDTRYASEAHTRLRDTLTALGAVTAVKNVTTDISGESCTANDYIEAAKPGCGFNAIVDELTAASERQ